MNLVQRALNTKLINRGWDRTDSIIGPDDAKAYQYECYAERNVCVVYPDGSIDRKDDQRMMVLRPGWHNQSAAIRADENAKLERERLERMAARGACTVLEVQLAEGLRQAFRKIKPQVST